MKRETHTGVGLLAELVTLWRLTQEQVVPEGLPPMGWTHAGASHEEWQPVRRAHVGGIHGQLLPMGGTSHWSRGTVWVGRCDRKMCAELYPAPIPHPPVFCCGRM